MKQGRVTEKHPNDWYTLDTGFGTVRVYSPTQLEVGYTVSVTETGEGFTVISHRKVQYTPEIEIIRID